LSNSDGLILCMNWILVRTYQQVLTDSWLLIVHYCCCNGN
jgi:hypothetical protein